MPPRPRFTTADFPDVPDLEIPGEENFAVQVEIQDETVNLPELSESLDTVPAATSEHEAIQVDASESSSDHRQPGEVNVAATNLQADTCDNPHEAPTFSAPAESVEPLSEPAPPEWSPEWSPDEVFYAQHEETKTQIVLVGTAHVSAKSAIVAEEVVKFYQPNYLLVELCKERSFFLDPNFGVGPAPPIGELIRAYGTSRGNMTKQDIFFFFYNY